MLVIVARFKPAMSVLVRKQASERQTFSGFYFVNQKLHSELPRSTDKKPMYPVAAVSVFTDISVNEHAADPLCAMKIIACPRCHNTISGNTRSVPTSCFLFIYLFFQKRLTSTFRLLHGVLRFSIFIYHDLRSLPRFTVGLLLRRIVINTFAAEARK
jgi:hypothetical protein